MKWYQRLALRAAKYAGIPLRDPALVKMLGNQPSSAGVDVDHNTSMNHAAVWQAVNIIASNIAAMPLKPYYMSKDSKTEAIGHPVWKVLTVAPNKEMTPFTFAETLTAHCLTWGNGYALIERGAGTSVTGLKPLLPNQTTPERNADTGDIEYRFEAMFPGEESTVYKSHEVLHIPGLGFDGLKGYNVIEQARESIGLGLAVDKYGAGFFGRGSAPGGLLELPEGMEMSEKAKKNLRESFEMMHRGVDNAHRVAILEYGINYKTLGLPLETAQFLQTRTFQVVEIARWFNIPPHLLRDLTYATFSNIEHQGIDFLVYTLRPWMLRWQQEVRRKLFTEAEQAGMIAEHDAHNLLLTDIQARYNAYNTGRTGGWLTLNNILRREGLPPLPPELGDSRLIPLNSRLVGPDGHDVFESGEVQATAMNGIQISAIQNITTAVAQKQLPLDSAAALIKIAFPNVSDAQVQALLQPLKEFNYVPSTNDGTAQSSAQPPAEG